MNMEAPEGFEPSAISLQGSFSSRLSYGTRNIRARGHRCRLVTPTAPEAACDLQDA